MCPGKDPLFHSGVLYLGSVIEVGFVPGEHSTETLLLADTVTFVLHLQFSCERSQGHLLAAGKEHFLALKIVISQGKITHELSGCLTL